MFESKDDLPMSGYLLLILLRFLLYHTQGLFDNLLQDITAKDSELRRTDQKASVLQGLLYNSKVTLELTFHRENKTVQGER